MLLLANTILKRTYPDSIRTFTLVAASLVLGKVDVRRGNQVFPLPVKEFAIFLKLAENEDRVITVRALCQTAFGEIWPRYESTLAHIQHLCEKIEGKP